MQNGDDYELNFRPATYWSSDTAPKRILANIKGADRKRRVKKAIEDGNASSIEDWMINEKLPEALRDAVGRLHPRFMGGEYLPDYESHEVEIARVVLQSATQDVNSIRARAAHHRIEYRIADEYETDWEFSPTHSPGPLSMQELIVLMDGAKSPDYNGLQWRLGVVWGPLTMNLESADDPLQLLDFIEVTSEFYSGLQAYYAKEIERFLRNFKREPNLR